MKKNILDLFLEKVLNVPLWIKQVIYLKLGNEMREMACDEFLKNHPDDIFSTFVPTLTFKGKTELPQSYVLADGAVVDTVYLSELSPAAMRRRAEKMIE